MKQRQVNKLLLRTSVKVMGLERLAVAAECSASLLQKLVSDGYHGSPSIRTIDGLCHATGHKIDDLFPFADQAEKEIA
jgi:transcriptional regulator with XRE-family HTH domain